MKKNHKKNQVALWAGRMSFGTLISRILGFIRDMLIAAFFSRTQTDIFFVAFRFPNFFRRFLGEGSFSASVTPVLTEAVHHKGKSFTQDLSSTLFIILFSITSVLTVLGIVFMGDIMNFLFGNSNYSLVENKLEQTIFVGQVVFVYLFLVASYSYFMSVAQVFGRFFMPALAPAFFNLSLIGFCLTPQHWWPFPAVSLAWAVVVGGVLQLCLILYVVYYIGFWPRLRFAFQHPEIKSVLKRFVPVVIGLSGLSLIGLINLYFAGWLQEGTHTYIYYGDRLLELPRSLIAISIGTALIPELSKLHSFKNTEQFQETVSYYLNFLLFLTLPCAVVFYLIPEPIIKILFERGQFGEEAVRTTVSILQIYSVVLIFSSIARVFSSSFFAADKNWYGAFCALTYVFCHGILAWVLTSSYGLPGLIWATALSTIFYVFILMTFMFWRICSIPWRPLFDFVLKMIPGLALLSVTIYYYPWMYQFLESFISSYWAQFFATFIVLSLGGSFYILSGVLIRDRAALDFLSLVKKMLFFSKKA